MVTLTDRPSVVRRLRRDQPAGGGKGVRTVCFASLYPPATSDPGQFLDSTPLLREIPRLLSERGYSVHVVQQFERAYLLARSGVTYHFETSPAAVIAIARAASRLAGASPPAFAPAMGAIRTIRSLRPDVVHLHGSNLYLNHFLLLASLARDRPHVVMQYHGGYPAENGFARRLQQHIFRRTERFLFSTRTHAEPFVESDLIRHPERIVEFMETSSDFRPTSRDDARHQTKMDGEPVFLWAARLDPVKDPITVLRGFERIVRRRPGAQLYLYYTSDTLLPEARSFVTDRAELRECVHFRGPARYDQMETIFNSADFLLQASRQEFSGCAVLEAMACGVIPVVTDIPSFRAMVGSAGVLFPCGDDEALALGMLAIPPGDISRWSVRVRQRFDEHLRFDVLADRLDAVYRGVIGRS